VTLRPCLSNAVRAFAGDAGSTAVGVADGIDKMFEEIDVGADAALGDRGDGEGAVLLLKRLMISSTGFLGAAGAADVVPLGAEPVPKISIRRSCGF